MLMTSAFMFFAGGPLGCNDFKLIAENDYNTGIEDGLPPDIEVNPLSVVFDDVLVAEGGSSTAIVTISNVGQGTLYVQDMALEDPEAPIDIVSIGSVAVPPEASTELTLSFSPQTAEEVVTKLFIDSNDPDEPTVEVDLSGLGIAPVIEVTPEEYDFGSPYVGCPTMVGLEVANVGNATLVVEGYDDSATATEDIVVLEEELPAFPWVIEPGDEPQTLWVSYDPLDEVSDTSFIKINSNDPFRPTVLTTQEGSGAFYGTNTDVFEQPLNGPVDILFALDKSCSMDDDIANVRNNFSIFVDTLASLDSDYHVAVVTEDSGCFSGSANYIDSSMSINEQQSIFDEMTEGSYGTYTEAPFHLMSLALSSGNRSGCNEGFYRENATLALVSVSDEREQSPNGWEYYVSLFQSMKSDDDDVVIHAIAADVPSGCNSNEPGTGHYEATVETGGVFLSICASDFGAHLQSIAEGSVSENRTFELSLEPVPETIEVMIDTSYPPTETWEYIEDGNYVSFMIDAVPEPGSEITISYVVKAECEG